MSKTEQKTATVTPLDGFSWIAPENRTFSVNPLLDRAKASFRANALSAYYGAAYVSSDDARNIHVFDGSVWELFPTARIEYDAAVLLEYAGADFDPQEILGIVRVMRMKNPRMGNESPDLISFDNGVLDISTGVFRPHSPFDWLTTKNGVVWVPGSDDETLETHAPSFNKWLVHASRGDKTRATAIMAAFYMVLTCRHDWEMYLSVSGPGGSGKSTMQRVCTMLAGEHNTSAFSLTGICGDFGLEHLMGKRFLVNSESESKWPARAVSLVKAITGGDLLPVNRKGEKVVSATLKAIMMFVGNVARSADENDNGGLARREIPFHFPDVVADADKDTALTEKIRAELPVIIRRLLARFPEANMAKAALLKQRDGADAKAIKLECSPLERFLSSLEIDPLATLTGSGGMQWNDTGLNSAGTVRYERRFVMHAYLSFCGYEGIKPSMTKSELVRAIKFRFGSALKTGKGAKNRTLVNLRVREDAEYLAGVTDAE